MAGQKRQAEDKNEYVPSKKAKTTKGDEVAVPSPETTRTKTPWCTKCNVLATTRHLRTKAHTGIEVRKFKCGGCTRAYARKDEVSRHVQNYTRNDCDYVNEYRRKPCPTLLRAVVLPSATEEDENTEETDEAEPSSPEDSTSAEAGPSSRDQCEYLDASEDVDEEREVEASRSSVSESAEEVDADWDEGELVLTRWQDSTSDEDQSEYDDEDGEEGDDEDESSSTFESADERDEEMSHEPTLVTNSPQPSLPSTYYWNLWLTSYVSNESPNPDASSSSDEAATSTVDVTGMPISGSDGFDDTVTSLELRQLFDIDKYAKDFGL